MGACDFRYLDRLRSSSSSSFFTDQFDRCLLFHGVNVSGTCKLPQASSEDVLDPDHPDFWSESNTFVGRPFSLDCAQSHFQRLKYCGMTFIRLVVTWEAIESAPGVYNKDYLTYLRNLVQIASDVGLCIVLDFHQDCWSRYTGGSGAPLWTMEIVGLAPRNFQSCGAALLQKPDTRGYAEPGTLWATNYTKFAVNTMFTLFFAGEVFAPHCLIAGENIGLYLRRHYFAAITTVLQHLKGIPGLVGVDAMNEPHHGFIGLKSLSYFDEDVLLHLGDMPSGIQSMRLAAGIPQEVAVYSKSWPRPTRCTHKELLNSNCIKAWRSGAEDIWRAHAVWDQNSEQDDYFAKYPRGHPAAGKSVDFSSDFYVPFLREFVTCIQNVDSSLYGFIEPVPNTTFNVVESLSDRRNICYAPHWYDLKVLFEKRFTTWITMNVQALSRGSRNFFAHTYFGRSGTVANYSKQCASIFEQSPSSGVPRLVGETGIPFDMNSHYVLSKTKDGAQHNDYATQTSMMDIICTAMERNLLSYTLWNYTPENGAYDGGGDLWNGEDFSIYCEPKDAHHDASDFYAGTRAGQAWIRPCATKIAGIPIESTFDMQGNTYHLTFMPSQVSRVEARTTEIFIPQLHLRADETLSLELSFHGIEAQWHHDLEEQTIYFEHAYSRASVTHSPKCVIEVRLSSKSAQNRHWALQWMCICGFILSLLAVALCAWPTITPDARHGFHDTPLIMRGVHRS